MWRATAPRLRGAARDAGGSAHLRRARSSVGRAPVHAPLSTSAQVLDGRARRAARRPRAASTSPRKQVRHLAARGATGRGTRGGRRSARAAARARPASAIWSWIERPVRGQRGRRSASAARRRGRAPSRPRRCRRAGRAAARPRQTCARRRPDMRTTSTSARRQASSARTPSSVEAAVAVVQERRRRGRAGCRRGPRRAQRTAGSLRMARDGRHPRTPSPGTSCSRPAAPTGGSSREAFEGARAAGARRRCPTSCTRTLRDALARAGIEQLYAHQAEALDAAWAGPTIVTTGTASGKSLCFNLPTLDVLLPRRQGARALPLPDEGAGPGPGARAQRARPGQARPARDLRRRHAARAARRDPPALEPRPHQPRHAPRRDPAQPPRVGGLLRQPRGRRRRRGARLPRRVRLARRQRAAAAAAHRGRLRDRAAHPAGQRDDRQPGRARRAADRPRRDRARRPRRLAGRRAPDRDVEPAADRRGARQARRSTLAEAARAARRRSCASGARTICFIKSRKARRARSRRSSRDMRPRARARRARRPVPRRLHAAAAPRARGAARRAASCSRVVTTDALELGIDIGALDAAVVRRRSRAPSPRCARCGAAPGRRGRGLAVYVAGEDALDQFFCRHPDEFLDRPVEAAILDHENEQIHLAHLLCAAHEGPLGARTTPRRSGRAGRRTRERARRQRRPRRARAAPSCCASPRTTRPRACRCARRSARLLRRHRRRPRASCSGRVEAARAFSTVHEGAVYLHLGRSYEVRELDLGGRRALVEPVRRRLVHAAQDARRLRGSSRLLDARETLRA